MFTKKSLVNALYSPISMEDPDKDVSQGTELVDSSSPQDLLKAISEEWEGTAYTQFDCDNWDPTCEYVCQRQSRYYQDLPLTF